MSYNGVIFKSLHFSGKHVNDVGIDFKPGVNLIYGASNTGKSFALKAIDFTLGASSKLPGIDERKGYDTIWVDLDVVGEESGMFSLSRSLSGGGITLYDRPSDDSKERKIIEDLESNHDDTKENNISQFLLKKIGIERKVIAKTVDGEKGGLSFRDIAISVFVDEKAIQNNQSPIRRVSHSKPTREKRAFRTLITGEDDNAIVPVVPQKKFQASKEGKLEILEEMISDVNLQIDNGGYDDEELSAEQLNKIKEEMLILNENVELAQEPIKILIDDKASLSSKIMSTNSRFGQVNSHLERFSKLDMVYVSDVERLKSIEEAGFLLSIGGDRECPLCGAASDVQSHVSSAIEIKEMQSASLVEINKINKLRQDLNCTIIDLQEEKNILNDTVKLLTFSLEGIESSIKKLTPNVTDLKSKFDEAYSRKEYLTAGVDLFNRRNALIHKKEGISKLKSSAKKDKPKLEQPSSQLHEFCQDVTDVLKSWGFPGECSVSFDEKYDDIRIDGKLRSDNGKGVRAVTHAAFKVALLVYCRKNNLPHPGFLILDTPLVTYRDPFKSKHGDLSEDEKTLAATPLKDKFFNHLFSLTHLGQFIVFDNIDPPDNIDKLAHSHEFTGASDNGRYGLF